VQRIDDARQEKVRLELEVESPNMACTEPLASIQGSQPGFLISDFWASDVKREFRTWAAYRVCDDDNGSSQSDPLESQLAHPKPTTSLLPPTGRDRVSGRGLCV